MAKQNIFDVILKTIGDVQKKNQANPNEPTADPSIFDILKEKLGQLDQKSRENRHQRGQNPTTILDKIRREIEGTRRANKKDPKVETAPKSIFDALLKKVEERPKRTASAGIRKIVEDYRLDVSRVPQEVLRQVQDKYAKDRQTFDQQYAKAIHDLTKQFK